MNSSFWFQLISFTLAVWPEWTKRTSAGPSCWSSFLISEPDLERSHRVTVRSELLLAKSPMLKGLHYTFRTLSVWFSKEWSLLCRFLRSYRAIVLSSEPVMTKFSQKGLKSSVFMLSSWAWVWSIGFDFFRSRESHIANYLSSLTLPNSSGFYTCQHTSSTLDLWKLIDAYGDKEEFDYFVYFVYDISQ